MYPLDQRERSSRALELLKDGNQRFISGLRSMESFASTLRLKEHAEQKQSPFAIILTCSDSRVPAEIIFDRGIGDLFVIRVAGNIMAPSLLASIEFAATSFHTPLCIVMGHTRCGAIQTAIQLEHEKESELSHNLNKLVRKIAPAVRCAIRRTSKENPAALEQQATLENVRRSVKHIETKSSVLTPLITSGKFLVAGAIYDLHSGKVVFDLEEGLTQRSSRSAVHASAHSERRLLPREVN